MNTKEIVERLRRKAYRRETWHEPMGAVDVPCDADDDGAEEYNANPDGPEAADLIEAQEGEIARLREALEGKVPAPNVADPNSLTPAQRRLLERGSRSKWIGLSNDAGVRVGEVVALGELTRAGLARPSDAELPPEPPTPWPYEITEAGRQAIQPKDTDNGR